MVEVPFRIQLGALKICAYGVQVASRIACAKETGQYRLGALKKHASLVYKYDACLPSRKNRGSTDMMLKFYPIRSVTVAQQTVTLLDCVRLTTCGL